MHTRVMEERAPDKRAVRPVQHGPRVLWQMRAERLDERKEALNVRALLAVQRQLTHAVLQQTRQHTWEEGERGAVVSRDVVVVIERPAPILCRLATDP